MAYEIKPNTGSIFKNFKKQTEKQPDFRGECLINGVAMWVSAWKNADKNNNAWFSLAFSKKEEKPVDKHTEAKANAFQPVDDDIPF